MTGIPDAVEEMRDFRILANMSVRDVATRMGITPRQVRHIERMNRKNTLETAQRYFRALDLGFDIEVVVKGTDDE